MMSTVSVLLYSYHDTLAGLMLIIIHLFLLLLLYIYAVENDFKI